MYIGKQPQIGNYQICDAISVVNGQAAYTMQVSSVNVSPESTNHMIVSLNGVIQKPGSSFTVSGSTITFSSNLATGDSIDFIYLLGNVLDIGVPSDATVTTAKIVDDAVTAAKINNDIISGSTELATAPADTDEFLVSDAGTLKRIDYSLIKGENNSPYFYATQSSDQSVAHNTLTKITYDNVTYNVGGGTYDTSNSRYTPGVAGRYFVSAWVFIKYAVSAQQRIDMKIYKNGSGVIETRWIAGDNLDGQASAFVQGIVDLDNNDYIEAYMFQTSGATRSNGSNVELTFFNGFKIAST